MDDTHMMSFGFAAPRPQPRQNVQAGQAPAGNLLPNTTDWYGRFRQVSGIDNDFLIDRDLQHRSDGPDGWTGIRGITRQDQAMTTSMGPIYDRSKEHLGSSDAMIIQVRRRLLDVARAYAETGAVPPGVDSSERSGSALLSKDVDWLDATRDLRRAFVHHPDLDYSLLGGGLSG
jgi:hypothetical protein